MERPLTLQMSKTLLIPLLGCVLGCVLSVPARAHAAPSASSVSSASTSPGSAASPPTGEPDLAFELLDAAAKPSSPAQAQQEAQRILEIERQVRTRRGMLVAHQVFGFASLAALAVTVVIGHLNYVDKYTSGDITLRYAKPHLGLGIATTGLFATTGALALFAPTPYPKKLKFDTALIHKAAMALATAGMAAQIILGPITASRDGHRDQADLALGHVITGYATFAFMTAGVVTYLF